MITRIKVPKLTENVDEVTITAWLKKEGEKVSRNEPLVEMTTDKAAFEVEAPHSGIVRKIIAKGKSVLPTGYVVALLGELSDALPDVSTSNAKLLAKHSTGKPLQTSQPAKIADKTGSSTLRATPAARRLAREKGIDLTTIKEKTDAEVITEDIVRKYC